MHDSLWFTIRPFFTFEYLLCSWKFLFQVYTKFKLFTSRDWHLKRIAFRGSNYFSFEVNLSELNSSLLSYSYSNHSFTTSELKYIFKLKIKVLNCIDIYTGLWILQWWCFTMKMGLCSDCIQLSSRLLYCIELLFPLCKGIKSCQQVDCPKIYQRLFEKLMNAWIM